VHHRRGILFERREDGFQLADAASPKQADRRRTDDQRVAAMLGYTTEAVSPLWVTGAASRVAAGGTCRRFRFLLAVRCLVSPADFGKVIAADTEKWAKVIRAANIKPE
jgi:hypothetical protein